MKKVLLFSITLLMSMNAAREMPEEGGPAVIAVERPDGEMSAEMRIEEAKKRELEEQQLRSGTRVFGRDDEGRPVVRTVSTVRVNDEPVGLPLRTTVTATDFLTGPDDDMLVDIDLGGPVSRDVVAPRSLQEQQQEAEVQLRKMNISTFTQGINRVMELVKKYGRPVGDLGRSANQSLRDFGRSFEDRVNDIGESIGTRWGKIKKNIAAAARRVVNVRNFLSRNPDATATLEQGPERLGFEIRFASRGQDGQLTILRAQPEDVIDVPSSLLERVFSTGQAEGRVTFENATAMRDVLKYYSSPEQEGRVQALWDKFAASDKGKEEIKFALGTDKTLSGRIRILLKQRILSPVIMPYTKSGSDTEQLMSIDEISNLPKPKAPWYETAEGRAMLPGNPRAEVQEPVATDFEGYSSPVRPDTTDNTLVDGSALQE